MNSFPATRAGTALAAPPRRVAVLVSESRDGVNLEMLTMLTNSAQPRRGVAVTSR